jgi:bifunctional DNA-binding transcriptional regulator/antitoxin component of YhaV-PrlF toxin-antitoxin module
MSTTTVQIRRTGAVTLPAKLRSRYKLEWGDILTLLDLGGAFLLCPKRSIVPELSREIEQQREAAGMSVEDVLEGLHDQRRRYRREQEASYC